ncbi:maleylacetoacetate isomerase [Noviherbaspirillum sp. CPCC 100848]|uniref:Maleylacetoacetate isomerase n=1 Tax=Noviherbaspirillum album TaxID=3080276 RepID=A0ABU6JI05_9BURK|nr:maleylacetoacetate isomerase [Noviherbaspirillum sp. CPCC 100848]MEC4723150.1 maleylacetoacetate isomerase [Noviherbaspirillum sp. CPCC 100848]
MKLYSYFRSSASFRVRIALNLKGLSYEYAAVHLVRNGGEQLAQTYRSIHADGLVPALEDDGQLLQQSLAIIEYLDEIHPQPPLLPGTPAGRAYARSLALQIACDIHPLNNLRVLKYLTGTLGVSDEARQQWYRHWVTTGFTSLEARLAADSRTGKLSCGDQPTLADLCLVPQVWNAQRFGIPLDAYPTIMRINDYAMTLDAFALAAPAKQPDAE